MDIICLTMPKVSGDSEPYFNATAAAGAAAAAVAREGDDSNDDATRDPNMPHSPHSHSRPQMYSVVAVDTEGRQRSWHCELQHCGLQHTGLILDQLAKLLDDGYQLIPIGCVLQRRICHSQRYQLQSDS